MERLVFHPDYTYSDFVGQIMPFVNDDGSVSYAFNPGPFTKLMKKAYNNPDEMFYLVIEEVNRGNAPAIFGDVFQLLVDNGIQLIVSLWICLIRNAQSGIGLLVLVEVEAYRYTIGTTFLLTNGVGICYLQTTCEEVKCQITFG